ncbi:nuclear transport factor 2 family protein [Pseudomonas sp. TH08]|uniref:nuclear transport factor 2 family protein n=1 Tax=unclassified Pseudomonas TaxID=196821 RepID=UPI0019132CD9|nr:MULTISPECIES: nuclear transport factor 2 family protein [unclassified Pseudomonas]MBK5377243.1 nuclear transport factor 2 family protein [Pseudomonas sp. TH43]MBK5509054.1 nuclear transport factor 2 family protein [Pseudomonas sp. TH15]MBK5531707.1 nuclear transport factor 2 family protein [Pseudomonas sp. TH08]
MLINEIKAMLENYFSVLQTQDLQGFDEVFHPGCVLYSAQDGEVTVRPFAQYRAMVQGRESPQERGFASLDEILMIDVMSPEMAMVKVRLRLFDNIMVDYLNVMKVQGKWMIFAKLFHKQGSVA